MWQATHSLEGETGQTEVAARWDISCPVSPVVPFLGISWQLRQTRSQIAGSEDDRALAGVVGQPVLENLGRIEVENGHESRRMMTRPKCIIDHEPFDLPCFLPFDEKLPLLLRSKSQYVND